MSPQRLWLISPLYYDVEAYSELVRRLVATLGNDDRLRGVRPHFVAIDDSAGADPDISKLEGLLDLRVLRPPFNLGHQRALVFGVRTLAHEMRDDDLVVTLDADGEDRPENLPRLLYPLLEESPSAATVALATRTRRQETLPFKVLYFFFRVLFRILTGLVVRSGNFVAYRGWVARRTLFHPSFDLCYSSSFIGLRTPLHRVPAERGRRYAGQSRMSYPKLLVHGFSMLLPFTDRIALRTLAVAAIASALSLAWLLAHLTLYLAFGRHFTAWPLWVPLIALFLSLTTLGNCVVLVASFTQARGAALKNLEGTGHAHAGIAPSPVR